MHVRGEKGRKAWREMHYLSFGFFTSQAYPVTYIFCNRKKEGKMIKRVEESGKILVLKDPLRVCYRRSTIPVVTEVECQMAQISSAAPVLSNKLFSLSLSLPDCLTGLMFWHFFWFSSFSYCSLALPTWRRLIPHHITGIHFPQMSLIWSCLELCWRNVWSSQKRFNWWLECIHAWVIKLALLCFFKTGEYLPFQSRRKLVIDKSFDVVTCKKSGNLKWTLVHVWDPGFKAIQ